MSLQANDVAMLAKESQGISYGHGQFGETEEEEETEDTAGFLDDPSSTAEEESVKDDMGGDYNSDEDLDENQYCKIYNHSEFTSYDKYEDGKWFAENGKLWGSTCQFCKTVVVKCGLTSPVYVCRGHSRVKCTCCICHACSKSSITSVDKLSTSKRTRRAKQLPDFW